MTLPARKRAFGVRDLAQFEARLTELRDELEVPTASGGYVAYTDGACLDNPEGPGGWAAVVDGPGSGSGGSVVVPVLLWGPLSSTSNNRAEALGVLAALEWVPSESRLEVHSDSQLTVGVLQGRFKARANSDIWEVIRRAIADKRLTVIAEWVRGHAGDPRNELADRLSKLGATDARDQVSETPLPEATPDSDAAASEPPQLVGLQPQGDWERDFLQSIARQLKDGRVLSAKQQAVIERIRARSAARAD